MFTIAQVLELSWLSVWFWLTALIALVWFRRHLDLNRAHLEPILTERDATDDGAGLPTLSVVVAGKDEEANIGRCVSGLLVQDYPRMQVVAVDDRSQDRTGAIIDELAEHDPRLVAVHVRELRPGWFGKNNAMREGLERASGELLCFTDADCAFDSNQLLRAAVGFARRDRVDFLSVLPELEAHTLWEKIIQPVAGAIMVFWFPPTRVNNPKSPCAYANGAFMLMSRRVYERIGGHEFARATLNEDMHFARQAKRCGVRLRVIRGGGMYRVRMYTGLRQIWRGWSRIFYGCFGTLPRLLVSVLMLSVFSISPYVSLIGSFIAGGRFWWISAAAGLAILAQQSILVRFYRISGTAPGLALTYPLGALVCLGMTLNAMTRVVGGGTTWRGTKYQGGAQAQSPASTGTA